MCRPAKCVPRPAVQAGMSQKIKPQAINVVCCAVRVIADAIPSPEVVYVRERRTRTVRVLGVEMAIPFKVPRPQPS